MQCAKQSGGELTARVAAASIAGMTLLRRNHHHLNARGNRDLQPRIGMTGIRHDADIRRLRHAVQNVRKREIAIEKAPRLFPSMTGKRDQQRVAAAQAPAGRGQVIEKCPGCAIDQHSLHGEAARRGSGSEIARVDGRRMEPAACAARYSGVQRDPAHRSLGMVTTGQLLPRGTLVIRRTGMVSGSGGRAGASV